MKTDERSIIRRIKYAASKNRRVIVKDTVLELNARGGESVDDVAQRIAEKSGTDWIYFQPDSEFRFYV